MVHYSSDIVYYEGGAKNPLKGKSLKFLVCAQNAQFRVRSGSKKLGIFVMAYKVYPYFRGGLQE